MAVADILSIWNMAVLNVGSKAAIASLTEQSAEAAACALRYQSVVETVLRQTNWNCTRMTVALDDITDDFAAPDRWAYRYAYPDNCLRIWRMQNPSGFLWCWPDIVQGFEVAVDNDPDASDLPTKYIYSNLTELSAIFTQYTYDSGHGYYEALFEPDLREAIGWALAAVIAGPLTGNRSTIDAARVEALRSLDAAKASCANESAPNSMDIPEAESLSIRDYGDGWPYSGGRINWP
jgi:hypothetical protein